ncbi:hypothetical protein SARC_00460 [Sphaeroforma arctica JP610]|uniref:SD-repeat containing protein B domain-containing protein n=1 Tax=Sphaeroforma arctica JP610 TaxID=667725 RepID=A0A0L0GGH2_9EUKA|nr:hypothetical protein SARC_00460 [Sphaeroforma arctica JP610]KNC87423.1 hypothetical protein SARC_00460 [Sphaeroforma arctica JP610]|eukprot:XP_014161325.1 hypothetical protein SARC_00460 [Sphaeroforma arctica JP610]
MILLLYSFTGTRPGTYTIRVPAGVNDVVHGLVSLSYDSQAVQPNDGSKTVTVKEGSHLNAGDFTYNVPGTLSGILTVGTYDNPIPNIAVKLLGAEGVVAASTTTNTKGRYSFKELLVGSYSVTVPQTIPNYRTTLKSEPFAGDATLDGIYTCKLTVQEPSIANVNYHYGQVSEYAEEPETVSGGLNSITGGIYSGSEASPLEGIEVELTDDETGKVVASTKTNANGQYGFLKVTPNKYYLVSTPATNPEARTEVLSRDYYDMQHSGTRTPMFFNAGRLLAHVDFVYAPPNQISGNIRDASGAGLAGVKVVLSHPNRLITTVQSTDTNGHYTFVNITKGGNYMINIAKPQEYTYLFDCYDEEYKHSLLDGESTVPYTGTSVSGVDFFLVQNGGIAGSARMADGTPMGHVKVTLRAKQIQGEGAADEFGVYTNSYGLYVFLDMAVDEYSVAVHEGPQLETLELISNVIDGGDDNQTPGTQDVSFATTQSSLILRPFFYDKKAKESTQSVDNSDVQTPEKGETDTTTGDTNGVGGEGSITGEVLSASALDPLGAVGVQLVDTNGDVLQTAMTNEKGVYTFSGLNFGIYEVACPLETTSMGKAFSMVDDPDHNVDGRARHVDVVQSVATRLPPFMFLEKLSSQLTTSGDNGRAVEDTQMLQLDPEVWGSWIAESRACDSTGIGTGTKCGSIIRFAVESCQTNTMYTLKDVAIGCEITQSDSSACQAFSEDSIDITFSVTSDTPCDDTQQHKSIVSEDAQVVTPIVQLYTEGNYATVRTHNKYELGTVMHAGIRLWINDTGNTVEHANIVHIERDSDGACAEYNGMSYGFDLDIKDFTQTFSRASADTFAEIHLELPITPDVVCAVSEQASNTVKFRFTVRVEYTTTDTDGSKNLVRRRRDVPVSFEQDRFTRSTLIDDVTCSVVVLVENTSVNVDRVSESPESATAVTVSLDSKSDAASGTRTSTSSVADTGSSGTSALMIVGIVLGVLVCLCCLCCASMLIVVIVRRRRRKSVLQWEAKQRFITGSSCNMNPDSTVGLSHAF